MSARIVEGIFTCTKRWALENVLENVQKSRRKTHAKLRLPMSGIEHVLRILCWLDSVGDPSGRMYHATVHDIELAACWDGPPGALVTALIQTGWIDTDEGGMRWHDYHRLNGEAIKTRNKQRRRRAQTGGTGGGTEGGTRRGTGGGTTGGTLRGYDRGTSESESGKDSYESFPAERADAAAGPSGPPPCAAPQPQQSDPAPVVWTPPAPRPGIAVGPIRRRLSTTEDAP